jgi:ABC-type transport system involved in cytochrome bd biosynthesis fused ATPase/permease subunit
MFDKRLLALVPQATRHIVATVLWRWVGLVGNIAIVWSICQLFMLLWQGGATLGVSQLTFVIVLAIVVRAIAVRLAARESFAASQDTKRVLRRKIFEKLLALGPGYTDHASTAELVQLSVEGTEQLETYFGQYLPQLFYAVVAPITLVCVILPIDALAAIVLLVCVPLIPIAIMVVQKVARRVFLKYWDRYTDLGDSFLENLQGLTTLKIYQADGERHERMNDEAEKFRVATMRVLSMQLNSIIVMDIVAMCGAAAGMAVALFALAAGRIDLFGCLFIILISADFFIPMRQLGSYFHVAMNGISASGIIFEFLDLEEGPEKTLTAEAGGRVAFEHVDFSYDEERQVLTDVSLDVPAHGMTAIVGRSGSGKSTIASLIEGRHERYGGSILVGGSEVRDIKGASLSDFVTGVSLGAYLFSGTVRDNLAMAAPDATDDQMWDALERASLADFMRSQDGLDTRLEQQAANLSGGQRQRLALARALLHDTPVYVFDEATSNIDVESEEQIMAVIRDLSRDHAVIMISHRLANAVSAQRIYVMESGQVVGRGTHEELLSTCETYRNLWETQQELEQFGRMPHEQQQ